MKKIFILFILLSISGFLRAQINAEFTWCPYYDTTLQTCCIQFEDLSVDSAGAINTYYWSTGDGGARYTSDPTWCYSVTTTFEVILIVQGPSGSDTVMHPLTLNYLDTTDCNCDSLNGITEISNRDFSFSISPNPFHDKTSISLISKRNKKLKDGEIRIYNSLGVLQRVEKITFDERQKIIFERKSLLTGLYTFDINSEKLTYPLHGKFLIE